MADLSEETTKRFIAFARYVILHKRDKHHLSHVKERVTKEYKKTHKDPRLRAGGEGDLEDTTSRKERKKLSKPKKHVKEADVKKWEEGLARSFKGYLPGMNRENERDAWRHITEVADAALSRYDGTMEDDDLHLAADDKRLGGELLSVNNKNCILYRKSEKAILHFLKETENAL